MCLGWAKVHRSEPLEGVLLGQGAAVFELEVSRSCPHSALTLVDMNDGLVMGLAANCED